MKTFLTYRPLGLLSLSEHTSQPCRGKYMPQGRIEKTEAAGNNFSNRSIQKAGDGDSWVPVSCEVKVRRSNVRLSNIYWHPGFSRTKPEQAKPNAALQAKKLGMTYKSINKGHLTFNQQNTMKTTLEIKKILIPTDFSETGLLAMEHAVFMARLLKAHVYLMHVVEAFEYAYSIEETDVRLQGSEEMYESVKDKLERLSTQISKENLVNVSVLVGNGKPAAGIAEAVKENDIDLIIMGTHGAKGFEEYFIGSNAHRVVNAAPCPVLTIQQHAKKMGFKNIVMPIDNSLYSRQKTNYVIKLASIYGSKVHILGLLGSDEDSDEKKFNIKLDSVENALKKHGISYIRKTVQGKNIATEALRYSELVDADLLVIMTDHESTLRGAFLGTMAKQIVNHSRIPVLSIRPLMEGHLDAAPMSASNPLF